jgi:hypothetical protein
MIKYFVLQSVSQEGASHGRAVGIVLERVPGRV